MDAVVCGVDLGTTNTKVLLLAADGQVLARLSHPTPRVSDGVGFCADADAVFALVETMIADAVGTARLGDPLAAICVTGTGEDGVCVDGALRPLDVAISWNDRRASEQAARLAGSPLWRDARLPVHVDPTRTAAKWAWLRDHRGDVLAGTRHWIALTDFPSVRWSGRPFMSETLATRTACYDAVGHAWIPALLRACGAPPLPDILPGGVVVGHVTTGALLRSSVVSRDTRIVAGGHDHPMAASLVCGRDSVAALDSLGTAELLYVEHDDNRAFAPDAFFARSVPVTGRGAAWLGVMELSACLEPLLLGEGAVASAFRDVMNGAPLREPIGAQDRLYFPWLDPLASVAEACGQSGTRTILEGCAFYTRLLIERAERLAAPIDRIYVAGGWARSLSFLTLRATVIGRPLWRLDEPQLSAFGSAVMALRAIRGAMPKGDLATTRVDPVDDHRRHYDHLFPEYRRQVERHLGQPTLSSP